jgi:hypothetical protein
VLKKHITRLVAAGEISNRQQMSVSCLSHTVISLDRVTMKGLHRSSVRLLHLKSRSQKKYINNESDTDLVSNLDDIRIKGDSGVPSSPQEPEIHKIKLFILN